MQLESQKMKRDTKEQKMFENLMNEHFWQIRKGIKKTQIQEVQRRANKTNAKKKERKKRVNSLYIIVGETTKKTKAKQKITGREKWRNRTQRTNGRNTKLKRKDLYPITIIISKITYLKIPDYLYTLYQNYEKQREKFKGSKKTCHIQNNDKKISRFLNRNYIDLKIINQ